MFFKQKYVVDSTRLPGWDCSTPSWYFVTICVRDRRCVLGDVVKEKVDLWPAGSIADSELRELSGHYHAVSVDRYVIMPNHVHIILVLGGGHRLTPGLDFTLAQHAKRTTYPIPPKAGSLSAIVRSYKAGVSQRCHDAGLRDFAWQPRFYDHIVRCERSLNAVRDYIESNPANWEKDAENPAILCPRPPVET